MLLSKTALVAVVAALAEQATAFNAHRHLHNQVGKRVMKTDLVVVWETVYVTAGEEPTSTPHTSTSEHTSTHTSTSTTTVQSTTSITSVVIPTSTTHTTTSVKTSTKTSATLDLVQAAEVAPSSHTTLDLVPAVEVAPSSHTTLATSIKPTSVEPAGPTGILGADLQIGVSIGGDVSSAVASIVAPASSAPTSVAPPATSGTGSGSSSGGSSGSLFSSKRGSAYNDAILANLLGTLSPQTSWAYNWGQTADGLDSKLSFVPTLWSADKAGAWDQNVETALKSGSKALFSFNEPDNAGQANMSPSEAASAHVQYMNKYSGRAKIGAPAISNSGLPGQGLEWLQSFVDACDSQSEKCAYDFCNIHWYSGVEYASTLFDQIEKASKICNGKPIWLTEFAPSGSADQIDEFMTTNLPKLDALDTLEAYSYFMTGLDSLFSSSNALSSFGKIYADISL